jgi:magnesium transporter
MEPQHPEQLAEHLEALLEARDDAALAGAVEDVPAADVAAAVRHLEDDAAADLLKRLPDEISADVLVELEEAREDVMEHMTPAEIAEVVEEMDSDDAADVVSELEEAKAGEVVLLLEEEDRREIATLLAYPEDSAGGIMQLEVVSVREDRTVQRAIEKIRMAFHDVENDFYYVYVVDAVGKLVGRLPLPRLVVSGADERVRDLMERDVQSVTADTDQEDVAHIFRKYDLPSVPVTDREGILLGRITHDDIVDVIHEEAAEDYSRLAGTDEEEFTEDSTLRKAAIRLPWLVTGLLGGVLSAVVLSRYEQHLSAVIALAFFVPVIMAMGGNVAIQSSAVMVRSLATGGTMSKRQAARSLLREVGVSIITGLVCAALIFLTVWVWSGNQRLGLVVGGSMLSVILISTSVGAVVPLTLARMNIDPALATGPFVTTSNDILGIIIYLTLASWVLGA